MTTDKRLFNAREIDSHREGWVADLSGPAAVNPDCYFYFDRRWRAREFLVLVDQGMRPDEAGFVVAGMSHSCAAAHPLGR